MFSTQSGVGVKGGGRGGIEKWKFLCKHKLNMTIIEITILLSSYVEENVVQWNEATAVTSFVNTV